MNPSNEDILKDERKLQQKRLIRGGKVPQQLIHCFRLQKFNKLVLEGKKAPSLSTIHRGPYEDGKHG